MLVYQETKALSKFNTVTFEKAPINGGRIGIHMLKTLQVRLVKQHPETDLGWFEDNKGKVFDVINKRHDRYDIDLSRPDRPRQWGWLHKSEVEEITNDEVVNPNLG